MKVLWPNFKKGNGLIVAIAQDARTKEILMQGFASEEAFRLALATGFATYFSRSRNELWMKGETTGNRLKLVGPPLIDCDGDSIIYLVEPQGPPCHTNQRSCFYRNVLETEKASFSSPDETLPILECEVSLKRSIEMSKRKLQIGVMGSASDLEYSEEVARLAEEVGKEVALAGCVLVFGAEKDYDSLSTAAGRGARSVGGLTAGVTYGKGIDVFEQADVIITCGAERGGPRESALVLSCDAIICISGGSGTLTEMLVAYQANIPIVALVGTGGWSDKMAGSYFDKRERVKVEPAATAKEAVDIARRLVHQNQCKHENAEQVEFLRRSQVGMHQLSEVWEVRCPDCGKQYQDAFIG